MKKLILALVCITVAISSCQKQALINPSTPAVSEESLSSDATHYYHGNVVTSIQEIPSYGNEESAVILKANLNNHHEYYYFDNRDEMEAFLKQQPEMNDLYAKALQAKDLRQYIAEHHVMEYVITHGTVPASYTEYAKKYKNSRWGFRLWDNFNVAPGNNIFVPLGGLINFPPGMDMRASSWNGPNANGFVYKGLSYGGMALGMWMPPGMAFINFAPNWNNCIRSAL